MNASDILQTVFSGLHLALTVLILSTGFGGIAVFLYQLGVDRSRRHPKDHASYNSETFSVLDE